MLTGSQILRDATGLSNVYQRTRVLTFHTLYKFFKTVEVAWKITHFWYGRHLQWIWLSEECGARRQKHILMPIRPAPIAKKQLTAINTTHVNSKPSNELESLSVKIEGIVASISKFRPIAYWLIITYFGIELRRIRLHNDWHHHTEDSNEYNIHV